MAEVITAGIFLPHVNKVFQVRDGRHALALSRVDVRRMQESELAVLQRQAFTLIFSGPAGDVLPEGLHILEIESGGPAFELYIIPIQTFAQDRQDYQAVFN